MLGGTFDAWRQMWGELKDFRRVVINIHIKATRTVSVQ